jgi:hypothetical protein
MEGEDTRARATPLTGESTRARIIPMEGEDTQARATPKDGEAPGEDTRAKATSTESEAPGPMTRARLRQLQESIRQLKESRADTSGEAEPLQIINISLIRRPQTQTEPES